MLKAGTWGAPQPHELTWAPPIALPALPVREGVTLCAPWVEAYERELEAALRASGRGLRPMPTAELHPNAPPDLLQLMRDEWRHDAHRANLRYLSPRPAARAALLSTARIDPRAGEWLLQETWPHTGATLCRASRR